MTSLTLLRSEFDHHHGYLDAASGGRVPRCVVEAMHADLDAWAAGRTGPVHYDAAVSRARTAYARIVRSPVAGRRSPMSRSERRSRS